jgi:ribosomal protein L11 methyltransferase
LPEAEEAVTEMLAALLRQPCASFTDVERGTVKVSVFVSGPRSPDRALKRRISKALQSITGCGLNVGPGRVSFRSVRRQDWAESWKRHFKPMEFGRALLVKPSWSRRKPKRDQAVVVLDPGLSFGTGQHPTTAFCLEQLVRFRPKVSVSDAPDSFLDIGTGSGILAIAAAKLGFDRVRAFDFDVEVVRIARANARGNGVSDDVRFFRGDILKLDRMRTHEDYFFVCANLTADLLLLAREGILARIATNGILVLAGILRQEFSVVHHAYEAAGLRLLKAQTVGEWKSGAFARGRI